MNPTGRLPTAPIYPSAGAQGAPSAPTTRASLQATDGSSSPAHQAPVSTARTAMPVPLAPHRVPQKPVLGELSRSPSQKVSSQATHSRHRFFELKPQQENALIGKLNEIYALERAHAENCGTLERSIADTLANLLPYGAHTDLIREVARAASLNGDSWRQAGLNALASLQRATSQRNACARVRTQVDANLQRQHRAAIQELALAKTALGSSERALQASTQDSQRLKTALDATPQAVELARAEVYIAERVSMRPLFEATEQEDRARRALRAFDAKRMEALRTRRWRQPDYSGWPVVSLQWWKDRSMAQQAKSATGYKSFRRLMAAYEHAKATHTTAVRNTDEAERTVHARQALSDLLADIPRLQAQYDAAVATAAQEQARLPKLRTRRQQAEATLAPLAKEMQAQCSEVAAHEQAAIVATTCKQQCDALVDQLRAAVREQIKLPLQRLALSAPADTMVNQYLVRLSMLQHKLQYMLEAQQTFLPEAVHSVQNSQYQLQKRNNEMCRSKRPTMTFKGLLWRLDHWEWEKRDANLNRFRKIVADVYHAQPDEAWSLRNAALPWTWWMAFTQGKHDAKYQPRAVAALAQDPRYRSVEIPNAAKNRASQAAAAMLRSNRGGAGARTRGYTSSNNDFLAWQLMADAGGDPHHHPCQPGDYPGGYGPGDMQPGDFSPGDNPDTRS